MPKQILVISEASDISTKKVINWVKYLDSDVSIKFLDIQKYLSEISLSITKNNSKNRVRVEGFNFNDFDFIWFRRGHFKMYPINISHEAKHAFIPYLIKESKLFFETLLDSFDKNKLLGNYRLRNSNRISDIIELKASGFDVPDTLISTNKKKLLEFYDINNGQVISKPIGDIIKAKFRDIDIWSAGTFLVNREELQSLTNFNFPILLQSKINKAYEIRSYFLLDRLYSIIIFSNNSKFEFIDFRNYINILRKERYEFEAPVEKKIIKFLQNQGYDDVSLDFMVDNDGKMFLIDINPVGQFDFVSGLGNYFIEKDIAQIIIDGKKK